MTDGVTLVYNSILGMYVHQMGRHVVETSDEKVLSEMSERYDERMLWINDPFGTLQDEPDWDELGRIAEMEDFAERGLGLY